MSEYRHIANLVGPQGKPGDDATEIPGASLGNPIMITAEMDASSLEPGIYRLGLSSQATSILGLPFDMLGSLEVKQASASRRVRIFTKVEGTSGPAGIWLASQMSDGSWGSWEPVYPATGVSGPRGHIGPRGIPGDTPQFSIGDVRPVTDPTEAAATVTGSTANPVLNLDLPRGIPAPDIAPTDESVASMIQTAGTDTHAAVEQAVSQEVNTRTAGLIQGEGVGRIIVSKDAERPIYDGDLLLTIRTPQYFTDFTGNAIGSQPYDWTARWRDDEGWSVESDPTATGGRALEFNHTNQARRVLSWDALDTPAQDYSTVEVVCKWRSGDDAGIALRVLSHGSGDDSGEYGYFAGGQTSSANHLIGYYTDGSAYSPGFDEYPIENSPHEWWITRYRLVEGEHLQARSWPAAMPEPDGWSTLLLSNDLERGWIGLMNWTSRQAWVDWVGVAFDGGRAPKGA